MVSLDVDVVDLLSYAQRPISEGRELGSVWSAADVVKRPSSGRGQWTLNGKPYILTMVAGPAEEGPRFEGYTFVNKTEFASMDDMDVTRASVPLMEK
ncbi:stress responsive a b barrel protein [Emericellopsis cladophorae]|uniref:Stress responsive a b barrel protein n=1 Tax=Emericellopsis cladophorae TaxID=2686198 RepID=A0A9P9XVP8_9HYPO|nr:stress responsive a b barrel protein [Emericellopsis cladophorae]KAI6778615.1 stress responsive a b barrel protein [Emericellopsis cladophorae]